VQTKPVTEQRPSGAYLGPAKGRWTPNVWSDVAEAAAGGLLDESHWVDLKQEVPAGKRTHNTELAQDLASLAIDGGLLVVGVEDHDSRAGKVCGVELARLADRVDQVARDKVRPSLVVRSHEVPDPDRPGWGCLLVHVPPSAEAPHMVDYIYYGRGDRANVRLSDEQVRAIIEDRRRSRTDVTAALRRMADDDPITADERQLGHLYLLAQPETGAEEALVEFLARHDAARLIQDLIGSVVRERGSGTPAFDPDLHRLLDWVPRAEGLAHTSYSAEEGPRREQTLLELVVREDGGIRLTCGRGTDAFPRPGFSPSDRPPMAVIAMLVLGLAHSVAALAGRLADEHAAYPGAVAPWDPDGPAARRGAARPPPGPSAPPARKPVQPRRVRAGHLGIDRGTGQRSARGRRAAGRAAPARTRHCAAIPALLAVPSSVAGHPAILSTSG
jgi:Putative DNA-binding domain